MDSMQELRRINLKQQRVEFFEENGFIPETDDLDIEEENEIWGAINTERKYKTRKKLFNMKYKTNEEYLYP